MLSTLKRSSLFQAAARRPPLLYPAARALIERWDALDPHERERTEARLLDRALSWARRSDAYAGLRAWTDAPPLAKAQLRAAPGRYHPRPVGPVSRARTSGTSGASLDVTRSVRNVVFEQAAIDWAAAQVGVDFRTARVAVLRADTLKPPEDRQPPYWKQSPDGRRLILSAHHLDPETFPAYAEALRAFRAEALYAYPSIADHLARLAEAAGAGLRFAAVVTSSEALPPSTRARLARVFEAATVDYYGQAERVAFAWSTEPGVYRFLAPYARVELAPAEDQALEIVGTPYHNSAHALIRYRTGDHVSLRPTDDPEQVARGLAPFGGIDGRATDVVYGPEGQVFLGLNHIPRGLAGFERLQVVQTDPDRVLLLIHAPDDRSPQVREAVLAAARTKIGPVVRLEAEFVDAPRRTAAGKVPFVIHDWKPA